MKLNRLKITLPAHLASTAHHDARIIAETIGRAAFQTVNVPHNIVVSGSSQNGTQIAQVAAAQIPTKGRSNGR